MVKFSRDNWKEINWKDPVRPHHRFRRVKKEYRFTSKLSRGLYEGATKPLRQHQFTNANFFHTKYHCASNWLLSSNSSVNFSKFIDSKFIHFISRNFSKISYFP